MSSPRPRISSREIDAGLAVLRALSDDPASPVQTPLEGWTCSDLAEIIGCSEMAIRRRLTRALLKLKTRLPDDILTH